MKYFSLFSLGIFTPVFMTKSDDFLRYLAAYLGKIFAIFFYAPMCEFLHLVNAIDTLNEWRECRLILNNYLFDFYDFNSSHIMDRYPTLTFWAVFILLSKLWNKN